MKLARKRQKKCIPQYRLYGDEAGRGPLAGPVTVGIILPLGQFDMSKFTDSKALSEKKRESLYTLLQDYEKNGKLIQAAGRATNKEIDKHGIIRSLRQATIRAIFTVLKQRYYQELRQLLTQSPYGEDKIARTQFDTIFNKKTGTAQALREIGSVQQSLFDLKALIFDGNHDFGIPQRTGLNMKTIIKGDLKNPYISVASIVAKVERDRYLKKVAKKLPSYGLESHKGYGTKAHRTAIKNLGISKFHRSTFCQNITNFESGTGKISRLPVKTFPPLISTKEKPDLLLHICCAPDLTRPLNRLKKHFKLHLFRYNPNIHPRKEHSKRYDQFLKLIGLEKGDYEILEDRYDPKEFFTAMVEQKETIDPSLKDKPAREVLQVAGEMEERSGRCNPCYQMRLDQAARMAVKSKIPYFTSTLLISPKKHGGKLFDRGIEGEKNHPGTKFLRFDFAKNDGYNKASKLTKKHKLWRQHYCGCGWTVPKPGEKTTGYSGG